MGNNWERRYLILGEFDLVHKNYGYLSHLFGAYVWLAM